MIRGTGSTRKTKARHRGTHIHTLLRTHHHAAPSAPNFARSPQGFPSNFARIRAPHCVISEFWGLCSCPIRGNCGSLLPDLVAGVIILISEVLAWFWRPVLIKIWFHLLRPWPNSGSN